MNTVYKKLFKIIPIYSALFLKVLSLIVSIFVLRWLNSKLNPEELANFNLINSLITILLTFSTFGLTPIINRLYSSKKSSKTLEISSSGNDYNQLWTLHFILQTLFIIFTSILLVIVQFYLLPKIALYIFLTLFFTQSILAIDGNYKIVSDVTNKSWLYVTTELCSKLLLLILLYLTIEFWQVANYTAYYVFCILICAILQLLADYWVFGKLIKFKKLDFKIIVKYKKEVIQFIIITCLISISANTDRFFLKFFNINYYEFNGYINAYKMLELSFVMEGILYPPIIYKMILDRDVEGSWLDLIKNNNWFKLFLFSSFLTLIGYIISIIFVLRFIDKDMLYYNYALQIAPILGIILLINGLNSLVSNMFIYKKLQYIEIYSLIVFAFCSLFFYLLLIPKFGIYGAAIASCISTLSMLIFKILYYLYIKKNKLNKLT
jgi:O-antigen/teichoic acid export membrane protein